MPNKTYNGTNPITDILGDLPTEREVTMTGLSTLTRIEPLTNTQIPAGQTVLVNVIGDMAHAQLVKNIQQINALQGFEVIGLTSVVIPDEPVAGDLLLVPTGATESADGEFQRFVWDGGHAYEVAPETFYPIWHAELSAQDRQSEYQIKLKMPELTDDQAVNVFITEADISLAGLLERDFNYFALELRANDGSTGLRLNIADDQANSTSNGFLQPAPGSVITLTLTASSLDYVYDGGTGSIDIPAGFFANPPNIWAYSGAMSAADVMPLSIKVSVA